tara:strand:- start:6426 stop:6746 length:321 start_codon:yes stop_codon:yes gene_type:complete
MREFDPGQMTYRIGLYEVTNNDSGLATENRVLLDTVWAAVEMVKADDSKADVDRQVEKLKVQITRRSDFESTSNQIQFENNYYKIISLEKGRGFDNITKMIVTRAS